MNNILSRETIVKEITNILTNFDEKCRSTNFKKGIYLYGAPGCGKTHFVTSLLNSLGYDTIRYDSSDVRNKSLIETITSNNISNRNVLDMMNKRVKPIAILMDEIEGLNSGDKGGITSLIKLIRQKKTKKQKLEHLTLNPIICIGNYYMDKKIRELMKVCNVFELKRPTPSQISKLLDNSIPELTNAPTPIKMRIIDYIQGDMRKLNFVERIYKKRPDFLVDSDILDTIFQLKSYNEDAKKISQSLINTYVPIDKHAHFMNDTDRTTVSLLYHENLIEPLWGNTDSQTATKFYTKVLENICFSDYIDRITFQNQIWIYNEMSSLIKTFYNNWLYHNEFPNNKNIFHPDEVRFTKVLTKYSTEYNNQLFIYNMCQELDMDKKDLISFFQELRIWFRKNSKCIDTTTKSTIQNPNISPTGLNDDSTTILGQLETVFEDSSISRLDIKRIYRYLDKNAIKDCDDSEISCG
jgi:SpoVK/Ycf46/Vps4 family AAA+-type ATPase